MGTHCKHTLCRVDWITVWPTFGDNNLHKHFQLRIRLAQQLGGILHRSSSRNFSGQQYSWEAWWLSWGHVKTSHSDWGQDSNWATSGGVFSSVEAILLLICSCVLGRCAVASPKFSWISNGGQMGLYSPDKLGINSLILSMITSCPGP